MSRASSKRRAGAGRQLALGFLLLVVLVATAVWAVRSRSRSGLGVSGADPANAQLVALGRQVYSASCASCHAADLKGEPNWQQPRPNGVLPAPPLDASGPSWRRIDRQLFAIVRDGGQATVPPGVTSAMPPFGASLSDERIWAVLAYIKSTWPPDIRAAQPQAP